MSAHKHEKPKEANVTKKIAATAILTTGAIPIISATTANAAPMSSWDRIAQCESGGRWNLSYGDADSTGGLQIQTRTWNDYKAGISTASAAYLADKNTQIKVAEKILASQGPGAWTCNAMTGYPLASSGPNASVYKGGVDPLAGQAPAPAPVPAPKPVPAPRPHHVWEDMRDPAGETYTVRHGDTLYGISIRHHIGDGGLDTWKPLYEANKDKIKDPDLIYPGQVLRLPGNTSGSNSGVSNPAPAPAPAATAVRPVPGPVTQVFHNPGNYGLGFHTGVDFTSPAGTPVKAAMGGVVVLSTNGGGAGAAYGNHVVIHHDDGHYTLYAHMSARLVWAGQKVTAGQQIGNVGSTGNSSGPHLHFELRNDPTQYAVGVFSDPLPWLRAHGVKI